MSSVMFAIECPKSPPDASIGVHSSWKELCASRIRLRSFFKARQVESHKCSRCSFDVSQDSDYNYEDVPVVTSSARRASSSTTSHGARGGPRQKFNLYLRGNYDLRRDLLGVLLLLGVGELLPLGAELLANLAEGKTWAFLATILAHGSKEEHVRLGHAWACQPCQPLGGLLRAQALGDLGVLAFLGAFWGSSLGSHGGKGLGKVLRLRVQARESGRFGPPQIAILKPAGKIQCRFGGKSQKRMRHHTRQSTDLQFDSFRKTGFSATLVVKIAPASSVAV